MDNHKIKIIHRNDFGWSARCSCCDEIQMLLGNIYLKFPAGELKGFIQSFQHLAHCCQVSVNRQHPLYADRPYIIRTPISNLLMMFSEEEYQEALSLLEMTTHMLSVDNLFNP